MTTFAPGAGIELPRPLAAGATLPLPIGDPGLDTPAMLVDLDIAEANIARMAGFAARSGMSLRPHVKTHKSVAMARRQLAAGASGMCVATIGEAAVLAAAGLLQGRRATSHWLALDRLTAFGAQPTRERVVIDGKYVTAAGVSAGIDMALDLSRRIAGTPTAQAIQLMLEYDPRPPLNAGSPSLAPPDLVATLRRRSRHAMPSR